MTVIAITASVYHIIVLSNVLDYLFNWNVVFVTHRAVHLSFFIVLTFLTVPMLKRDLRDKLPWYDVVLAILGFSGCAYIFIFYERELFTRLSLPTTLDTIFGIITIVVLLEASRRLIGWFIPALVLFFLLYTLYCNHFPGFLHGRGYPIERILLDMYVADLGIWGDLLGMSATMIFMFILFAAFLQVTGGGDFFFNIAQSIAGRFRGGPAKVSVVSSTLFGMVSGSSVANVAVDGPITIPLMVRTGYRPTVAAAIEAVASTGGMIMPPVMGTAAFIMANWLQVSYWKICVAAWIPAILYYASLYFMIDFEAARTGMKGLPRSELPSFWKTLLRGWVFIAAVLVLVYFIGVLKWNPTKGALYSIVALIIVSLFRKETRVNLRKLLGGLEAGAKGMLEVAVLCATLGIMVGCIYTTGLGVRISSILVDLAGGNLLVLLLLTAITSYILGMGLPTTACYIVLAALVAPAITQAGVPPIAAHLFVLYWGVIGEITPPVCGAVFVASAIAGTPMMSTGLQAMRLALVVYMVPFIFVYNPAMVAIGSTAEIVLAAITGIIGVAFFASGVQGYLLRPLTWLERLPIMAGAILLVVPMWQTDLIGVAIITLVTSRQIYAAVVARRKLSTPASSGDKKKEG